MVLNLNFFLITLYVSVFNAGGSGTGPFLTNAFALILKLSKLLLCSSIIRAHIRQLLERFLPDLVILSASEIPKNVKIVSLGVIE